MYDNISSPIYLLFFVQVIILLKKIDADSKFFSEVNWNGKCLTV